MNHATIVTEIILGIILSAVTVIAYIYVAERVMILNEMLHLDSEYETLCGKEPDNV